MLTRDEEYIIRKEFEGLLDSCVRCETKEDKDLVNKAFDLAFNAHKDARRRSGEPYIMHPLSVAKIVSQELGLGVTAIVSSLLHDVVEDTELTLEDIERNFNPKIASIIDGLTKIDDVFDHNSSIQAENFRKMLLTLSDDVRVIMIKLADRLHNMRTLDSMPVNKQIKIAGETIYLYAPLAHRLGFYAIKTELEDLSLKYRYPKAFNEIKTKLDVSGQVRTELMSQFAKPIVEKLNESGLKYEIAARTKSVYSIWNKMQSKNIPFEEIFDLDAMRIVFEPLTEIPEKTQCWNIYAIITDIYMPKPDRIRDWVSTPKANGYEALHCTVMGPNGNWVEVQIRSHRMNDIAERGYAAHWKYKLNNPQETELDKWLKKIREMLKDPDSDALQFLDEFKLNLFASEIIIFSPKGDLITLPKGATALDFAYDIHSQIGNKALGAKVNYKLVPLNYVLRSGDQVEIITSDKQKPQREWLNYAVTVKARAGINAFFKSETRNRVEKGKQLLEQNLKLVGLVPSSRIFRKLLPAYECTSKEELYSKIGLGEIILTNLDEVLKKNTPNKWIQYWQLSIGKVTGLQLGDESRSPSIDKKKTYLLSETEDTSNTTYTIAKCCSPIPGDDVIGYINDDNSILIHKVKCPNALKLVSSQGDRVVSTKWSTHKIHSFLEKINIAGVDHFGVYHILTGEVSKDLGVNVRTFNFSSHDGIFEVNVELYVHDVSDLNNLIQKLLKVKGVETVTRVENIEE